MRQIDGAEHHRIKGHDFYYVHPLRLSVQRKKGYMYALQEVDWGITSNDLKSFTEIIRESVNNGDMAKIAAVTELMAAYRENYAQSKVLIKLATNFILVDDEPWGSRSEKHDKLKIDLCERYEKVEDFFLTSALNLVTSSDEQWNPSKIKDYLKGKLPKESEKAFLQAIKSSRYKIMNSDITSKTTPLRTSQDKPMQRFFQYLRRLISP